MNSQDLVVVNKYRGVVSSKCRGCEFERCREHCACDSIIINKAGKTIYEIVVI